MSARGRQRRSAEENQTERDYQGKKEYYIAEKKERKLNKDRIREEIRVKGARKPNKVLIGVLDGRHTDDEDEREDRGQRS